MHATKLHVPRVQLIGALLHPWSQTQATVHTAKATSNRGDQNLCPISRYRWHTVSSKLLQNQPSPTGNQKMVVEEAGVVFMVTELDSHEE
jgi:hypothetical protein